VPHVPLTGLKFPMDYLALMVVSLAATLVYGYLFMFRDKTIRMELARLFSFKKAKKA
jgi:hypothetical protein